MTAIIQPTAQEASSGQRLLDALTQRDFTTLERLLAEDVWLRALLPRHVAEQYGSGEVASAFRSWFGGAKAFRAVDLSSESVASKERVTYRFLLRPEWAPDTWHLIEQTALLSVKDRRVRKIDLVCSGFLPIQREAGDELSVLSMKKGQR